MIVSRVYFVPMKHVYVQVKGSAKESNPVHLFAEKVEEDQQKGRFLLYNKEGEVIASFNLTEIVGWWLQDMPGA